ncbi:MAG: Obg family GTPase CgtA [Planctomycetes bacterium]|nr:Obg family GTPase CgtA [Planctomycetota bacterium]
MFVDEHELIVRAGKGGDGRSSFRHESQMPKGGPDGGDGGDGGDVVFVASHHMNGLGHLQNIREIRAKDGGKGEGSDCAGKNAPDTIVEVPVGTVIHELYTEAPPADAAPAEDGPGTSVQPDALAYESADETDEADDADEAEADDADVEAEADAEDDPDAIHAPDSAFTAEGAHGEEVAEPEVEHKSRVLADMNQPGMRVIIARGGNGGFGNRHFATATNQAPRRANPGRPGQSVRLRLEVKLIADVGLVGLPNAGKSTLLARCSRARPKIAAYPFTTLSPYLGIVDMQGESRFVMADIPGLIEGASHGKGLGHQFLRHVERTRVLLHLIDVSMDEVDQLVRNYEVIEGELAAFSATLAAKPRVIVANKADIPGAEEKAAEVSRRIGKPVDLISGVTGKGVKELLWKLFHIVKADAQSPA